MKSLLKIIFNFFVFCVLWWIQGVIMLGVCFGLGLWDPLGPIGATPGIIGLVCFYTSYVILKQIHQIQFIQTFFSKN